MSTERDSESASREATSELFDRWIGKASENIDEWGLQDEETLLLAIQEELGELTQAHLEARAEGGDPARVDAELDDLGALLIQLHEAREDDRTPAERVMDENDLTHEDIYGANVWPGDRAAKDGDGE